MQPQVDLKNYQNINSKCFDTNVNFINSSHQCYAPAENHYSTLVPGQDQTRVFQLAQQNLFSECHVQRNNNQPSVPSQLQNQALFYSDYSLEHYQYQQQVGLMTTDSKVTGDNANEPFEEQVMSQHLFDYNSHTQGILDDDINLIENNFNLSSNTYGCSYCKALQDELIKSRMIANFPQNINNYVQVC